MAYKKWEVKSVDRTKAKELAINLVQNGHAKNKFYEWIKNQGGDIKKLKDKKYKLSNETVRNDLIVKVRDLNMIYHNRLKIENIIKENTTT